MAALLLAAVPAFGGFKVGDTLPPLSTYNLEGALPNTKNQVVLLDFWASWCGPCKQSFPEIERLFQEYKGRGLTVIAVSVDEDRAAMQKFLKNHGVSFPVAWDRTQALVAKAEPAAMPTSLLIDRAGRIRFVHNGFGGAETVNALKAEIESLLQEPATERQPETSS